MLSIPKRIGTIAGVLALGTAATFTFATVSGAAGPAPINVANDHVTCTSFYGTFGFSPALGGPPASPMVSTIKATVDGCTDSDNANVKLAASKVSGSVTYASNNALSLEGKASVTGTFTVTWKTASGAAKLTAATSTLTFGQINSGTQGVGGNFTDQYPFFQTGTDAAHGSTSAPGVSGDFKGGDAGVTSTFDVLGSQSLTALLGPSGLGNSKGIKTVTLGIGQIHLS